MCGAMHHFLAVRSAKPCCTNNSHQSFFCIFVYMVVLECMHQRSDAELNRIAFIISKLVNLDICIASMKWQKRHNEMVKSSVLVVLYTK